MPQPDPTPPAMRVLWFEFLLALRRLARRRAQNGLMLVTFAVSVTLSLLSWTLFHTVHLSQPDFDPAGKYLVMTYAGSTAMAFRKHSSREEIEAYKAGQTVFEEFSELCFYHSVFVRTPTGEERFLAAYPSAGVLQVTRARPLLGRLFLPDEDKRGTAPVALLSERMWENSFGRDPDMVGKTMLVTGETVTIVGVLPRTYRFPNDQDLWLCYGWTPGDPRIQMRDALVTLKPGVTPARAVGDLQVILDRQGPESPANKSQLQPALIPLRDFYLLPNVRVSALILFALAVLFVLVSCANAANLMLIDFLGRRSEVATSLALGIPRGAAMRAVIWQVGVIALLAALISLAVLPVAGPLLFERVKSLNSPYWLVYQFQGQYAVAALVLAAISAAVTMVAPILYLLWVNPDRVIREHGSAGRGAGRGHWRRVLLAGQIGLLTVLGVTAALLVRSSHNVGRDKWGYDAGRIFMGKLTSQAINLPKEEEDGKRLELHYRALAEVRNRPETAAAALAGNPPGYSSGPYCTYSLEPGTFTKEAALGEAFESEISADYFETLQVPLVAGEKFPPPEELKDGIAPAIINESLAQKLWPGQDPLQRAIYTRFYWMKDTEESYQVVVRGVVKDFQSTGPTARTNDAIFFPYMKKWGMGGNTFLFVRDHGGVPTFRSLNEAVHRTDPRLALFFPSTIKGQIDLMLSSIRMTSDLTTVFALAALLLCAIGVYSLTVTQVLQSSREFGIRMALGAEPGRLWAGFARGHLLTVLLGVGLGVVGASQAVRVLGTLLYGVDPHSAATYAGVALAILMVAALACIPSLFRLRRINPADCLRSL